MLRCVTNPRVRACLWLGLLLEIGCSSPESSPGGAGGSASPSGGTSAGGGVVGGSGGTATGGSAAVNAGSPASAGAGAGASASAGTGGASAGTGGVVNIDECPLLPSGPVTFSLPSGTFRSSVSVALTMDAPGVEIRYTIDHTPPSANSPLYEGTPLTFSATTELRVQAFAAGAAVGAPQTAVYVARAFDANHDLPVIVLDSYGRELPPPGRPGQATTNRDYVDVALVSFEPSDGMSSLAGTPALASSAAFHIRGQSSAAYAKPPYRLEVRDGVGEDRDCALLGMPAESDWVLHSPYPDKALIRNAFVYSLGKDVGLAAPRAVLAEVYVNTALRPLAAEDYQGVYLLVETIKNQKNRLNLQQLRPTDTTLPAIAGGYIFKSEWRVMDIEQELACPTGQANCWDFLEVVDPEPWVPEQADYLSDFLQMFSAALHSPAPADPSGYAAYIDTASFVNQVVLHELTRNIDAYTRSQFFHKDRDGKMTAGPLWDYDLTFGVGAGNLAIEGFQYESSASRFSTTADWFPMLIAEPAFHAALVARWQKLRQGPLSDANVQSRIARLTAGLANAAERNFQKWDILSTLRIGNFQTPTVETWEGQVEAMQTWMIQRMAWLDTQWR